MTDKLDDVEVLRECLKTIRSFRKMGYRNGGGTTATEDRISRVLPRVLDELERLRVDAAAEDEATGQDLLRALTKPVPRKKRGGAS